VLYIFIDSPAPEFYVPIFRNTISSTFISGVPGYNTSEDVTDRVFRNVGTCNSEAGGITKKRKQYSEHGESLKSRTQLYVAA
jgi:hypothetical protein